MTAKDRFIKRTININTKYLFSELPADEAYDIWSKESKDSSLLYEKEMNDEYNLRLELKDTKCGV